MCSKISFVRVIDTPEKAFVMWLEGGTSILLLEERLSVGGRYIYIYIYLMNYLKDALASWGE